MKNIAKRSIQAALTTIAVTASLTLGTTNASAINQVACGPEFVKITVHRNGTAWETWCFANAGTWNINFPDWWITRIETGNNRVQWYGDGAWRPSTAINKYTIFAWPSYPDGVRFDSIKIL